MSVQCLLLLLLLLLLLVVVVVVVVAVVVVVYFYSIFLQPHMDYQTSKHSAHVLSYQYSVREQIELHGAQRATGISLHLSRENFL